MTKNSEEFDNELRGALFQNKKRREGKNDPHYQGQCEVEGQEYRIAGWKKLSKSGETYMSLSFTLKTEEQKIKTKNDDQNVDDIPF